MRDLVQDLAFANFALAPGYLLISLAIGAVIWVFQRPAQGFWRWIAPKDVWLSRSTLTDVVLIVINRVMAASGLVAKLMGGSLIASYIAGLFGTPLIPVENAHPFVLALIVIVAFDFATYWVHRFFHNNPLLWPLHAVHHSAEVLTPLTTYRAHPLSLIIGAVIHTAILGAILGLVIGVIDPSTTHAEIIAINAFWAGMLLLINNFHHSHIWVSYGPIIERLVISPAQHQVHHSIERKHYDKNYGGVLAIWDWMFGTLYLITKDEKITFGLSEEDDAPLMTQRIWPILIDPVHRIFRKQGSY